MVGWFGEEYEQCYVLTLFLSSICKKEVLFYLVHNQDLTESENTADGTTELESSTRLTNQSQRKQEQRNQMKTIFSQNGNGLGTATPLVEDDVAFFKRITQTVAWQNGMARAQIISEVALLTLVERADARLRYGRGLTEVMTTPYVSAIAKTSKLDISYILL